MGNNWISALFDYDQYGVIKQCPYCNSKNVEGMILRGDTRDSLTVKCRDCKRWDHFDAAERLKDPPEGSNVSIQAINRR